MKNILFCDLDHHRITGSSQFFSELLSGWGTVHRVWGGELPAASHGAAANSTSGGGFDAAIFWQVLPPLHHVLGLRCDNLTWVPMWDGVEASYFERLARPPLGRLILSKLKILCFSRALYQMVSALGFQCLHLQYYPPLPAPAATTRDGIACFFWQRRERPDWTIVRRLLGETRVEKVLLKLCPDPGIEARPPLAVDRSRFGIEVVKQWTSQDDYLALVATCNVFFSPRVREGIGMAMLEAMAMGLCVVNADAATGNEYIEHGVNGLLYDARHPDPLDFACVSELGQRARESCRAGRRAWLASGEALSAFLFGHVVTSGSTVSSTT